MVPTHGSTSSLQGKIGRWKSAGASRQKDPDRLVERTDASELSQDDAHENGGALLPTEIQEALLPSKPTSYEHPVPLNKRRYMVFLFCVVAALLFADQNVLAPNLTAAAEDFGLNGGDGKERDRYLGGYLMAAFFAVGAPAALAVGWMADKVNRRNLLFAVVVFGEAPMLATYLASNYWEFFVLRTLTGVAVGGTFPLLFSLLGDLFPPTQRSAVSAVVQISTGLGIALGQGLSATIYSATGSWRLPFVVVALPALAAATLMLFTTQEPPRGSSEEALQERYAEGGQYTETISWPKVRGLLRIPTNWFIILQGLPGSLPWGMMLTFFNDYLHQDKGLNLHFATLVVLLFGAGGALGVIAGGAAGQLLYNRVKEHMSILSGTSVLIGMGPLLYLVNADLKALSPALTAFMALLGGAIASIPGPNLRAIMLNVNEPETRGVALALQSTTDDLGKGLGPVFVAAFIQAMGRQGAFNVAVAAWLPCALLLLATALTLRKDEAAMQARLKVNVTADGGDREAANVADGGDEFRVRMVTAPSSAFRLGDEEEGVELGAVSSPRPPPVPHQEDAVPLMTSHRNNGAANGQPQ